MSTERNFSEENWKKILSAIQDAERNTSGEIRLFVEDTCKGEVLDRAAFIFRELKMHETKSRNGVLFYLAVKDHKFAILGDSGIHSTVHKDFWDDIKLEMQNHLTAGDFVTALSKGIHMAGEAMKKSFPFDKGDKNELSDEIIFGSNKE